MKTTILISLIFFFSIRYGWSTFAGKRKISEVSLSIKFFRKLFELIVFLILPILIVYKIIPNFKISNFNALFFYTGFIFVIIGLFFIFFARFERKKEWGFMGDRPIQLTKTGIYSITRHPYYIGSTLFILGIYLQLNSLYVLTIIPGIIFLRFVIKKEENELNKIFKSDWREYKKKVGIMPFL